MAVTEDFNRRLYRRIDEEERTSFWIRWVRPWLGLRWRPALSLAAASAAVVAAFLVQAPQSAPRPAETEIVDAEQVERALDDLDMLRQLNLVPRAEAAATQAM